MEADHPAGTVADFHFGRRAIHTAPQCGRQRAASHARESFDGAASTTGLQHIDGPHLVRASESSLLDWSPAPAKTGSFVGASAAD